MTPLHVLSTVAGAALLLLVLVDTFLTTLAPASPAPLGRLTASGVWWGVARLPGRVRAPLYRLAGPLAIVANLLLWLALIWVGFALLYLPFTADLGWSTEADGHLRGAPAAAYLSGQSLTQLTFSDVVPQADVLRTLTMVEAVFGLGLITATLGYLPAIYTLVSELRTANQLVADLELEQPGAAEDVFSSSGIEVLAGIRADLVAARQHLQRFPVLNYFHPPYEESVVALARGGVELWRVAVTADDDDRHLQRETVALARALHRLVHELAMHAGHRRGSGPARASEHLDDSAAALEHAESEDDAAEVAAQWHRGLDAYAAFHHYPVRSQS